MIWLLTKRRDFRVLFQAVLWYNLYMNHKPLSETNPYLKDAGAYEKYLLINVSSSATVELGRMPAAMKKALKEKQPTFIYITPELEKEFSQ